MISIQLERFLFQNLQTKKTLNNANQSISDIGAAARSIKNLTDYLERHPEAILKGKGK